MNHFISLQKAVEMTTRYRAEKENVLAPAYKGQNLIAKCETFDRDAFDTLLSNPGCVSIRVYYGMDDNLKVHAIVVGVNAKNEDILPGTQNALDSGGEIVEESRRCPDDCPPPSPLN